MSYTIKLFDYSVSWLDRKTHYLSVLGSNLLTETVSNTYPDSNLSDLRE